MEFSTINRTIRHVVQAICRLWSWHSVPVSKRRGPSCPSLQETSVRFRHNLPSLKHQQRSDRMVSLRDYEICLLFLLLVKFHGSGKCEVILPYKGFDNIFLPCAILSFRRRKRRPFISEHDFRQNDFRTPRWLSTVFVFQNLDMFLEFQSRDKWGLNNYDAIEIKSKGFYASSVTIHTFRI